MTCPQDYKPPSHLIDTIHLTFLLNEESTRVESRMRVLPNPAAAVANGVADSLFLDGREGACCLPGAAWLWALIGTGAVQAAGLSIGVGML
jgi:hypothetical protein